jgi:hypothetical protein
LWLVCLALLGPAISPPARAGNLNACDEARVLVREAISAVYRPLLADLDKRLAAGLAQTTPAPGADRGPASSEFVATRSDLKMQEVSDFGTAVKRVERDCRSGLPPIADIAKSATDLADHGIASVLAAHGMTADLGVSPRSP